MHKSLRRKLSGTEMYSVLEKADANGWEISETRKCHIQLKGPGGALIYASGTPSDHRAVRNLRSQIRRAEALAEEQKKCQSSIPTSISRFRRDR